MIYVRKYGKVWFTDGGKKPFRKRWSSFIHLIQAFLMITYRTSCGRCTSLWLQMIIHNLQQYTHVVYVTDSRNQCLSCEYHYCVCVIKSSSFLSQVVLELVSKIVVALRWILKCTILIKKHFTLVFLTHSHCHVTWLDWITVGMGLVRNCYFHYHPISLRA